MALMALFALAFLDNLVHTFQAKVLMAVQTLLAGKFLLGQGRIDRKMQQQAAHTEY